MHLVYIYLSRKRDKDQNLKKKRTVNSQLNFSHGSYAVDDSCMNVRAGKDQLFFLVYYNSLTFYKTGDRSSAEPATFNYSKSRLDYFDGQSGPTFFLLHPTHQLLIPEPFMS